MAKGSRGGKRRNKKSLFAGKTTENTIATKPKTFSVLNNKDSLVKYLKEQVNVDITKAINPKSKKRSYLDVDFRKLTQNEITQIRTALNSYGHKVQILSNGVHNYAIMYEKK